MCKEIDRCPKAMNCCKATDGSLCDFKPELPKRPKPEQAEASSLSDLLWRDISTAPKDGTEIVGWFVPNEVDAQEKAKPWITKWKMNQFKDGTGKKIGEPFGMWFTEGWRDPMSYAPTHWAPKP